MTRSVKPDDRNPWKELERLAREISPNLPCDLSGYEIRTTLNRDFQGVELICHDEQAK